MIHRLGSILSAALGGHKTRPYIGAIVMLALAVSAHAELDNAGRAEAALLDGDYARAESLGEMSGAWRIVGEAREAQGDLEGAAKAYGRAAEKDPDAPGSKWMMKKSAVLAQVTPSATPQPAKTKTKPPTPGPTPTRTPTATSTATPTATSAATAVPAAEPTATVPPTLIPTVMPTAAPTSSLEEEKAALEREKLALEREKLEEERAKLRKEREAMELEKRQVEAGYAPSAKPVKQGGISFGAGLYEPGEIRQMGDSRGLPLNLGLGLQWKHFVLGLGFMAVYSGDSGDSQGGGCCHGEGSGGGGGGGSSCPTCPNSNQNASGVQFRVPWASLGYELEPWPAGPGQWRPYVPVNVRYLLNYAEQNGQIFVASTVGAIVGLGLRWRIGRLAGLDFSARWNFNLAADPEFVADNGKRLTQTDGKTIVQPQADGIEFGLGLNFYLW
jgi:hypothetical protein